MTTDRPRLRPFTRRDDKRTSHAKVDETKDLQLFENLYSSESVNNMQCKRKPVIEVQGPNKKTITTASQVRRSPTPERKTDVKSIPTKAMQFNFKIGNILHTSQAQEELKEMQYKLDQATLEIKQLKTQAEEDLKFTKDKLEEAISKNKVLEEQLQVKQEMKDSARELIEELVQRHATQGTSLISQTLEAAKEFGEHLERKSEGAGKFYLDFYMNFLGDEVQSFPEHNERTMGGAKVVDGENSGTAEVAS
ncbi:hypothetical protein B0J14DRAFT_586620 [Halenospora varia]|nr:hypothetical protein B0J14DRAFT_586620 [Halenospora varia]